jgi:basic amino acid/polyamine antiporter, APA family
VRFVRGLGVPALFAIALTAVGASVYFILGVVAGDALGLTPVVFVLVGVFFAVTMMTYVEGNALHPERGGASTFARYAFDELWSFIAGWAILLDYLIVLAICAFSVPHYLEAYWGEAGDFPPELLIAGVVLLYVAWRNVVGVGVERLRWALNVGLFNLGVLLAVVVAGAFTVFDVDAITDTIDLGTTPQWDNLLFAAVVATIALIGIEAASGLAAEIRVAAGALRRVVVLGAAMVLAVFFATSAIALMAVPVEDGRTALGSTFIEAPILGVVSAYDPAWLKDAMRYLVGGTAALVLLQAANGNMLGVSRLGYSLATNRQIPSAVGKLHPRYSTPYITIAICSGLAFGLVLSSNMDFLAGLFAFGAMLAFTLAHVSIIVLRFREPQLARAFRVPLSVKVGRGSIPIPSALGAVTAFAAWISVIALHEGARVAGGLWMVFGISLYVIHRRVQRRPLRKRFTVPAQALQEPPDVQYGSLLVPVFGGPLDDDIVGTAGRLAAEEGEEGEGGAVIEALYVHLIPMSLPIDARLSEEQVAAARRALARAKEVGEEYAGVEVATAMVRARSLGAGIVEEARRRGVEAIVLAAEPPSRIRGGAILGGRGGTRERFVDEMTKYVVEKAPSRVILTAAPAGEEGEREGVAP